KAPSVADYSWTSAEMSTQRAALLSVAECLRICTDLLEPLAPVGTLQVQVQRLVIAHGLPEAPAHRHGERRPVVRNQQRMCRAGPERGGRDVGRCARVAARTHDRGRAQGRAWHGRDDV